MSGCVLAQATEVELRDLVNELNIMANVGEHPNVVNLIGACTIDGKFSYTKIPGTTNLSYASILSCC
jgi:hypothetical protein